MNFNYQMIVSSNFNYKNNEYEDEYKDFSLIVSDDKVNLQLARILKYEFFKNETIDNILNFLKNVDCIDVLKEIFFEQLKESFEDEAYDEFHSKNIY